MKRAILTSFVLLSVAGLTGCALFYPNMNSGEGPEDPMNPSSSASALPTETPETESPSPSPTKALATPQLTYYEIDSTAKELVVIGEVTNIDENGGTCTATFYSGNTPIATESGSAEGNVSTTQCFPIRIPLAKLPKGTGDIVISYESDGYIGESEKFEVVIP